MSLQKGSLDFVIKEGLVLRKGVPVISVGFGELIERFPILYQSLIQTSPSDEASI